MGTEVVIEVTLVFSPRAREVREVVLVLARGSTVGQALEHSGWLAEMSALEIKCLEAGVWGRPVELSHVLHENDRIELVRALTVDPKVARRQRFSRQGTKSAGLFFKRRSGAKAGY
jgi:putative ubiquitin-RnfH superfamily antitoxin RatB of RatAB toxin-antitoxin module